MFFCVLQLKRKIVSFLYIEFSFVFVSFDRLRRFIMTRSEARIEAFKLVFQITAHKDSYPDVVVLFEDENSQLKKPPPALNSTFSLPTARSSAFPKFIPEKKLALKVLNP